jgi:ring-1,2-phenylacetyl-CoA epoxidase subunit PaaE
LDKNSPKNYVLFAAGSGITPVFSIAKSVLENEPESDVTLFYGNKGFSSIIFREEIEALKNLHLQRFRVIHILSRESLGNQIQKGRIDSEKCEKLAAAFLTGVSIDKLFVCGPETMIHAVKDTFSARGISDHAIHFELFGSSSTETKKEITPSKEQNVDSNVTIILDGDLFELALQSSGETILDAAYKAGADLPFACKGGVCCTCKAKIIEGTARMDINYALEKDEVEAGYILTCQSHPTSEKLVISFDD